MSQFTAENNELSQSVDLNEKCIAICCRMYEEKRKATTKIATRASYKVSGLFCRERNVSHMRNRHFFDSLAYFNTHCTTQCEKCL